MRSLAEEDSRFIPDLLEENKQSEEDEQLWDLLYLMALLFTRRPHLLTGTLCLHLQFLAVNCSQCPA